MKLLFLLLFSFVFESTIFAQDEMKSDLNRINSSLRACKYLTIMLEQKWKERNFIESTQRLLSVLKKQA